MLVAQNQKLKIELKELIKPFGGDINNFERYRIIYDFLSRLSKDKKLKELIEELKKEAQTKQKSVLLKDGFFNCLKKEDLKISSNLWVCYLSLSSMYQALKKYQKASNKKEKLRLEKYLDNVMSDYQNKQMLDLSLWAVSHYIFDLLDKEMILNLVEKNDKNVLYFDEAKSFLFVAGYKIPIAKNDKTTNAHKILKYIFRDNANNLNSEFFYSEIAEDEFEDLEYRQAKNSWRRYYCMCQELERKIKKHSNNIVDNFLVFNTGSNGRIKISPAYLTDK